MHLFQQSVRRLRAMMSRSLLCVRLRNSKVLMLVTLPHPELPPKKMVGVVGRDARICLMTRVIPVIETIVADLVNHKIVMRADQIAMTDAVNEGTVAIGMTARSDVITMQQRHQPWFYLVKLRGHSLSCGTKRTRSLVETCSTRTN
jgi:hypothetical protein